ncbi:hypothetical protein [Streptomyces africanus]|uniref:hypothetical protein n=1 Tax=Streptomyces africanus TaxID=231024 RepID=UPI000A380278|nr:hypothetical protein [Streptomyces africanus]
MTDVIISRQGFGENDELPATVTEAAPGQVVVVPDGRMKHVVFVDGEQAGVVFDESAARLERGAFAVWAPKQSKRRDGTAGFYPTLEDAALAAVGRTAKPAETDSKGRRIVTVKGKRYIVSAVTPARPKTEGAVSWIPEAYACYWSERNGETFGPMQRALASRRPGTVGRAIWDAISQ